MKQISRITIVFLLSTLMVSCLEKDQTLSVTSPNKKIQVNFDNTNDVLKYKLVWNNETIVEASEISILSNLPVTITKSTISTSDTKWNPVWGQFSEIRSHYNELVFDIEIEGTKGQLFARVFDNGIGFRYKLDEIKNQETANFHIEYKLPSTDKLYFPAGENDPIGPLKVSKLSSKKKLKFSIPVVVEKSTKNYISLLESDLYAGKGFKVMKVNFDKEKESLFSSNSVQIKDNKLVTPWRVILLEENVGDLLTNTTPINLATPNQIENTDWIKPGKTVWDWRVHGYTTKDGFTYGVNTESYKRFIDFASKKGIEYFMIDANWFSKTNKGSFEIVPELDLELVTKYASEKGIELILYYDRQKGDFGDDELFPHFQSTGMKGIKYGFMRENVDFSREAIQKSAENHLLIDFHDSPVPFTGIRRTYPNAVTREYCHAQQDSRKAFTPEGFIKMALINAIQGPLDMNNGNFDLVGINSGIRKKGPKKPNSYPSTVTSEVARTLIIFSGLVCIPDAPESYETKADLFEFIQKMPVGKWDETKISNAVIGESITTARRYGKEWFIGSVIDQKGGELDINLDFLDEDLAYEVTFYEDTSKTDCKTNPEAYQIRKELLKKGKKQMIKVTLAPGGGHCMWIRPKMN